MRDETALLLEARSVCLPLNSCCHTNRTTGSFKDDTSKKAVVDEQWLRGLYMPHMQDAFAEEEAPVSLISQVSGSEEPTLLLHADGVYCIRCVCCGGCVSKLRTVSMVCNAYGTCVVDRSIAFAALYIYIYMAQRQTGHS